jgi:hypothetical protein
LSLASESGAILSKDVRTGLGVARIFSRIGLSLFVWFSPNLVAAQSTASNLPISVTFVPVGSRHSSSVEDRVVVIEHPFWAHPTTRTMKFRDPLLNDSAGNDLETWLNEGSSAVIYRVTRSNVSGCKEPPETPSCVNTEPFVVNFITRETISRPTALAEQNHPSFRYNESLVPINQEAKARIREYLFLAHPGLTQAPSDDKPEMWRVLADGTNAHPVAVPYFDTGSHGCSVSPDAQFLTCEPPPRYPLNQHGIRLSLLDGTKPTYIKRDQEKIGIGFVVWQPNSGGFVYYSFNAARNQGWIVYCRIDQNKLHSADVNERQSALEYHELAPTIVPSQYCLGTSGDLQPPPTCNPFGAGNVGSEIPVWSPDSSWIYYSGLIQSKESSTPRRVVGRVSIKNPNSFEPLTLAFAEESGHPAISPDGSDVAFLAPTSKTDPRTQLFLLNIKTRNVKQLTSTDLPTEAHGPQWWTWTCMMKP